MYGQLYCIEYKKEITMKRARESRFLKTNPPSILGIRFQRYLDQNFLGQTAHQAGCESVKTWQNSNAALLTIYFLSLRFFKD